MTRREARKRDDYRFWISTTQCFINELIDGKFDSFEEWDAEEGIFETGTAILELGWVDIELNINAASNKEGAGYINKVEPSYFIRVKGIPTPGTTCWSPAGYLDDFGYEVKVDWTNPDWEKELENDMLRTLLSAVEKLGLKIDEPNWEGEGHDFDVFDRINHVA